MEKDEILGDREVGIGVARRQIEALDAQLVKLWAERSAIAHYLEVMSGETVPPPALQGAAPRPQEIAAEPPTLSRAYPSRQFNRRAVEEALEIISRKGHPMTAPEIHLEHSRAMEIGTEGLYRLIYNRVIAGSLYSLAGAFWPVDRPIPEGWDISLAKRKPKPAAKPARGRAKAQ